MVLTKEALLKGIDRTVEFKIKAINDTVLLRPLSQAEIEEYENFQAKAMGTFETNEKARRGYRKTTSSDLTSIGKINLSKTGKAQSEAERFAVAHSLSCNGEEYTSEEVGTLDGDVFYEIFTKVKEISGIDDVDIESEVDDFPQDE